MRTGGMAVKGTGIPVSRARRVAIQTLGCPKNTVDSDTLVSVLRSAGYEYTAQPHRADLLVVNTCGFLDDAKVEAVHVLLEAVRWKQARRGRRVLAMGCLTQRDGAEIAEEIPELDGVFGIGEWAAMLSAIGENPVASPAKEDGITMLAGGAGPGSAYLRISDGCSHACAFCAIPQMRGLYHSEPMENILREAELLVDRGAKELILIGQETTSYGVDLYRERRIVELCSRLSELEDLHWIRILYAHPPSAPPHLLESLARVPKLAPYLDFPIEHASDRMLKAMNRRTTARRMGESIAAFRSTMPRACVRTSVLVGFPGETDEDFEVLYRFMEETRFQRAGAFAYSPQAGTVGALLPDAVEEGIALDRLDRIMRLQKRICLEEHQPFVGCELDVLIERCGRGVSWGRSGWDAPDIDGRVRVKGEFPAGQMIKVKITGAHAYQLDGEAMPEISEGTRRDPCGKLALPVLASR